MKPAKDTVPLVDNCQIKKQLEGSQHVVKVVVTVAVGIEVGVLEFDVTTVSCCFIPRLQYGFVATFFQWGVSMHVQGSAKQLHTNDGEHVVQDLTRDTRFMVKTSK